MSSKFCIESALCWKSAVVGPSTLFLTDLILQSFLLEKAKNPIFVYFGENFLKIMSYCGRQAIVCRN